MDQEKKVFRVRAELEKKQVIDEYTLSSSWVCAIVNMALPMHGLYPYPCNGNLVSKQEHLYKEETDTFFQPYVENLRGNSGCLW